MKPIIHALKECVNLLYPPLCIGCERLLTENEKHLCLHCEAKLAYLNFVADEDSPLDQLFWGRVGVEKATAYFRYVSGGISQHILHGLKYESKPEIGVEMGYFFGQYLKRNHFFSDVDYLVPVPLHRKRLRERGYNQSERICQGLAKAMGTRIDTEHLVRRRYTNTQTKKTKQERTENVKDAFELTDIHFFTNKHMLLVDDVVTTGSTLETCVQCLAQTPQVKISIACLAMA